MFAELLHIWPWLLACFAIGAGAGAVTRRAPENGVVARWLVWTALAFGVAALVVRLGAVADATAFVEGALAAYAVFIIGAALGALARDGSVSTHEGWAVGLIAAALVWVGAMVIDRSSFDEGLRRRYAEPIESRGADAPRAPSPARDAAAIAPAALPLDAKPRAAPTAPTSAGVTLAGCQAALEEPSASSELVFRRGEARITPSAAIALNKAAAIIRRCPEEATIEIMGHVRGSAANANNDALAQRRAQAAISYLERQGLGRRRLVEGRGESRQSEARAITFEVR
ncbi:MAG: OmpA family protein [Alphaproteobacteria bacterium]|nr:OmpA family protein [Alphaproteobacteria bacterium]